MHFNYKTQNPIQLSTSALEKQKQQQQWPLGHSKHEVKPFIALNLRTALRARVLISPPGYRWESRKIAPNRWVSKCQIWMQMQVWFCSFSSSIATPQHHTLRYFGVVCITVYGSFYVCLFTFIFLCFYVILCPWFPVMGSVSVCTHTQTHVQSRAFSEIFLVISTSLYIVQPSEGAH